VNLILSSGCKLSAQSLSELRQEYHITLT
jgi:hypothetical protein